MMNLLIRSPSHMFSQCAVVDLPKIRNLTSSASCRLLAWGDVGAHVQKLQF